MAMEEGDESGYRWHSSRGHGQLERFERVDKCGQDVWSCLCASCGNESHTVPVRCSAHRVCLPCRQRRAAHERDRFRAGRDVALRRLRPVMRRGVGGNKFREVFFTLTVPHDTTANDIKALYDAWGRFRSRVTYYLLHRLKVPKRFMRALPYVRVTEIGTQTEGGHVHFHFWAVLPFIHYARIRRWWGEALRGVTYVPVKSVDEALAEAEHEWDRAGIEQAAKPRHDSRRSMSFLPWPVLDVRSAKAVETELVKYLVKDLVGGEDGFVEPVQFADWYCALEGRRLLTASLHFWVEGECACQQCGTVGMLRVVPKEPCSTNGTSARGPPAEPCFVLPADISRGDLGAPATGETEQ